MSVKITIPDTDLDVLSFCDPHPTAVADWVASLPMANTADTATQLRQATFELTRFNTDFSLRMELLECVRPTIHYICARLDKTAVSIGNQGDAIARLAQRLTTNLCSGYKVVIVEALRELTENPALGKNIIPLAVHRALSDLSRTLLRTLQYYVAPAERLWLDLNQLYLLAERLEVNNIKQEDPENHSATNTTIADTYLRSLLLACCKPNQLRHRHLSQVFNALEVWTPQVAIENNTDDALFLIDLESDHGPKYSKLLQNPDEPRSIRSDVLVYELEAYLKKIDGGIEIPEYVPNDILNHLVDAWGLMKPRAFRRAPASGSVKICLGLRAAHYFLSGGVEFADQLPRTDAVLQREVNPFLAELDVAESEKDVWDDAFDLRVRIPINPSIDDPDRILQPHQLQKPGSKPKRAEQAAKQSFCFYDTIAVDTSPGGYRIRWKEPLPGNVQTGELLGLRDETDPRWCIAVVRWIRQNSQGAAMGIQLLAPRAIPVAVRVIKKRGGPTDYVRALLLPALPPIDQPATLITPVVPFQEKNKIHVQRQGIQTTAQLTTNVLRTESFNQFTFRMLDGYLENARIDLNISDLSELIGEQESGESN
ncbi:MAG: hypothetical protein V3S24_08545 [Candidatus Tectomicrobia bacterium]